MPTHDISVAIAPGETPTYPGDPGIEVESWAALARGDAANVTSLRFGAHTATHLDAPAHFIEGASKIDATPLDTLIGPARVVLMADDVDAIKAHHLHAQTIEGA